MSHLRIQSRDAVIALLKGLATSGNNVFPKMFSAVPESITPCLEVHIADEVIELETTLGTMDRSQVLEITALAQSTGDIEALLAGMLAEVEAKMATDTTLSGLVDLVQPTGISDITIDGKGAKPTAEQSISYKIDYATLQGAPDTPV